MRCWQRAGIRNLDAGADVFRMNAIERHALTPAQFGDLAEVPPELEWFPNISRSTMARLSRLYER